VLVLVLALALATRLYRLAEYTTFQGDQGIDALAVMHLLVDHQVLLEGPSTSAGRVHLGPAYYYLLALPMLVKWLDPLADAVLMALLGAAAVGLVFVLARRWFGLWPAVVAAGLYALSPAAIVAAQSAWNPSPAPFFAMLAVLALDNARRRGTGAWLLLVGLALGVLIQLHYFSAAIVVVVMAFTAFSVHREPRLRAWAFGGLGVFSLLQTPLVVHELLTGFPNVGAAAALGAGGSASAGGSVVRRTYELFSLGLVGGHLTADVEPLAAVVSLLLAGGLSLRLIARRPAILASGLIASLLAASVALGIVYRGPIFAHYWLAISPVLFLALAAGVSMVPPERPALVAASLAVVGLLGLNAWASPLRKPPEQHLARSQAVAEAIGSAAASEPFSIRLVSAGESDGAYRFQLERMGTPPAAADAPLPAQLFVICPGMSCAAAQAIEQAGPDWSTSRLASQMRLADDDVFHFRRQAR
jgi:hypothetical protein